MALADALERSYRSAIDTSARSRTCANNEETSDKDAAVALAVQQWVRALHSAFYAPAPPRTAASSSSSGNKFIELETTLTHVLTALAQQIEEAQEHAQHEDVAPSAPVPAGAAMELWTFAMRVVLTLATEPAVAAVEQTDATSAEAPVTTSEQQQQDVRRTGLRHEIAAAATDTGTAPLAPLETPPKTAAADATKRTKKAKKPKSAQPFAPLAFVVVNALKKLTDPAQDAGARIAAHFRTLGQRNDALVAFCRDGLERPDATVRPCLRCCGLVLGARSRCASCLETNNRLVYCYS